MIRRALFAMVVAVVCFGSVAEAADLPLSLVLQKPKVSKPTVYRKKSPSQQPKAVEITPRTAKTKVATAVEPEVAAPKSAKEVAVIAPRSEPQPEELELSWFLDSLYANADGPKGEGSASMEGNLIVAEPGYITSPYMIIEISGHVIKTQATTVRVDVRIGTVQRSVIWASDEVKSGRFSVTINAPMEAGKLPGYFPVSALALVSRDGKQGAAMVSLERIRVRLGKVSQVAAKQ